MSAIPVDQALEKFKSIRLNFNKDYSEADTRVKMIDSIFKECLGWDEKDIIRETHVHDGYIDYEFKIGDRTSFILEAKKSGEYFEIPLDRVSREYSIKGIISKTPKLINAMEQVQKYCIEKGVTCAIVSNGHQYVIFEAFRPGKTWREGKCIVYHSLEDIESNFSNFIKYLSYDNVSRGSLYNALSDRQKLHFRRPLDEVHNKNAILNRNYLAQYVIPFIEFLFLDITKSNQINVLRNCYIYEKALYTHDDCECFIDVLPSYHQNEGVHGLIERINTAGIFQENYLRWKHKGGEEPVFILGGVGAGKTTFLHRFYKIILEKDKKVWFYIDASRAPVSKEELGERFNNSIIAQFSNYIGILSNQNQDIVKALSSETKVDYINNVFNIIRSEGYPVSLIIDNVDKCTSELQELIIQEATSIASIYETFTVVSLREETYYKYKMTGVLDQYHTKKFHVASPHFERLILVRINYLLDLLKKTDEEISLEIGHKIDFENHKNDVIIFFEILRNSLTRKDGSLMRPITHFVTSISEGNMRDALELFDYFLSSGNTRVEEMMEVKTAYQIQDYQFLKSVILSDHRYYSSEKSKIMNLFEPDTELSDSHFLYLRILNYAYLNQTNAPSVGRGFVNITVILSKFQEFFINPESIKMALNKMIKFNLIKFDVESKDLKDATYFKITSNGKYYFNQIKNRFIYASLIQFDTPICDHKLVDQMKKNIDEDRLPFRINMAREFLQYLKKQEETEFANHLDYSSSDLMKYWFMPPIIDSFEKEVVIILRKNEIKRKKYLGPTSSLTIGDHVNK